VGRDAGKGRKRRENEPGFSFPYIKLLFHFPENELGYIYGEFKWKHDVIWWMGGWGNSRKVKGCIWWGRIKGEKPRRLLFSAKMNSSWAHMKSHMQLFKSFKHQAIKKTFNHPKFLV
jgi:hypothetical protein